MSAMGILGWVVGVVMAMAMVCSPRAAMGGQKGDHPAYAGFPISLNLKDADVRTVLLLIAEETGINLLVADDVKGKLDVHLVNVPWDQALDEILRSKDLVKRRVGKVVHVSTIEGLRRELEVRELLRGEERKALEDQQKTREMLGKLREEEEQARPLVSRTFTIQYAKAAELQKNLLPHLTKDAKGQPRGGLEVNEFSNTLVVRDIPEVMDQLAALLAKLDRPTPQILIEARIVDVNTDAIKDIGIQWGGQYERLSGGDANRIGGARGYSPSSTGALGNVAAVGGRGFMVNVPTEALNPALAMGLSFGKLLEGLILDVQLTALENQGRAQVLSRPKIVTMDNYEAIIKRGEDIPYILRGQANEVPNVQWKEAKLQLKVKPHVIGEDRIAVELTINNDSRTQDEVVAEGSVFPIIARQEATTRALVKDGDTMVLGGIIQQDKRKRDRGVPFLQDVPGLSWLFKRDVREETKRELLIFITPRILEVDGG